MLFWPLCLTKIFIYAKIVNFPKNGKFFIYPVRNYLEVVSGLKGVIFNGVKLKFMKISRVIKYRKTEIIVLLAVVFELSFPHYSLAFDPIEINQSIMTPDLVIKSQEDASQKISLIAPIREVAVVGVYQIPVTAYSSTIDQTDSTPCITANGFDLCAHNQEDVIAANFLPFGTKVRIPELFGDQIFTVQDRMNARYYYRADVWMKSRQSAREFGIAYAKLEVLE